jgi:hypothetical protein
MNIESNKNPPVSFASQPNQLVSQLDLINLLIDSNLIIPPQTNSLGRRKYFYLIIRFRYT